VADPVATTEVGGYNSAVHKLSVDPTSLWDLGVRSEAIGLDMVNKWSWLMSKVWDQLHIGWSGAAQAEAELFFDDFNSARIMFFGLGDGEPLPPGVPENNGVLPQLLNILKSAASLYGHAEESAYQRFKQFHMILGSSMYNSHVTIGPDNKWLRNPDGKIVEGYILRDEAGNFVKDSNGYYVMEYVPGASPEPPEYATYDQQDRYWIDALYEKQAAAEDPIRMQHKAKNSWEQPGVPDDVTVGPPK
jgi:hypothetical protein